MKFTPIDLQTWPRSQMFYYFSKMAPTGYSMTVNVDVTEMRKTLRDAGLKFFPAYLWLVTKNLNRQTEFKVAEKDGVLGYYQTLTPLYASFHEDDHTFSLMWTEYADDFQRFYQAYLKNQETFHSVHGVLAQPKTPPPANAIRFPVFRGSALPTSPFTAMKISLTIFPLWKRESSMRMVSVFYYPFPSPATTLPQTDTM